MTKIQLKDIIKLQSKLLVIRLMKYWFGVIDQLPPAEISSLSLKKIAILVQERFGDTIVLTPLIKHLRSAYPHLEIVLVGVRSYNQFLENDINVNKLYNLRQTSSAEKNHLFSTKFDIIYNTKDHPSFTFLYLSRKIQAKYRIGIEHPSHRGYYHYLIPQKREDSVLRKNCYLLDYLGVKGWEKDLSPYFPEGPVSKEIKLFVDQKIKDHKVTGINLSASNPLKSWRTENFVYLLNKISQPTVILSMPDKIIDKNLLEQKFKNVITSPTTLTLFDAAYIIRHLKLLISPDTSLIHLAACYNIPVVVLYRLKIDQIRFPAYSEIQKILISPNGDNNAILPAQVMEAYMEILKEIK